jgi:galactokinase
VRTYPTLTGDVAQAFAPGRVNLIGEHTDYNDGLALPFAIAAGITVKVTAVAGDRVDVLATDLRERDSFPAADPAKVDGWRAFPRGVVAVLAQTGVRLSGTQMEISSNLPTGTGLSSSAALTVALSLAVFELAGAPQPDPVALAKLCQRVEHEWVGAQTGLLDQLASLCASSGHATLIDFRELSLTPVPLPLDGHRLVVLDSGERRRTADIDYNRRRQECEEAAYRVGAQSLRDALFQDLHMLPDPLARRARHVIGENGRVLEAVDALERRDFTTLGGLLDASHVSLRDNFDVSTPTVERTVKTLKDAGALGARLLGAGFGGSVLALMTADASLPPGSVEVRPSPGAHLLTRTTLP